MDKNAIKKYAVWARRELISRVSQRAALYEITAEGYGEQDAISVHGRILSDEERKQRIALIAQIREKGYEQVMEEIAYTWFNRFSALRFMEVNGYLPSRVRVFTDDENRFKPQILTEAINMELDGLDMQKVYALKNANDDDALFKYMIIVQCNALSDILPGMFQRISDYTELLFPDNLLREGSVVEQMITMIPQEDWTDQVQIIGWLYQYYNTEPKDQVFANLKKNIKITKENIPAATQLFTPDWIVRYMVENSLGKLWIEGHPNDELRAKWTYYLDEAQQEPEVEAQLAEIRKEYAALKPEDILAIDPCQGSGHILAYMFDVFVQIYEAYGYSAREAVASILEHNIWGLDIDERAAQLAYFSVMMKARQYDKRFFKHVVQPHVYAITESNKLDRHCIEYFVDGRKELKSAMDTLVEELHDAKEYGSILSVTQVDFDALYGRFDEIMSEEEPGVYSYQTVKTLLPFVRVAQALSQKYHVVVTNPPYMAVSNLDTSISNIVKKLYPDSKNDLFACFIERGNIMTEQHGFNCMVTMQSWMFLSSFEKMRVKLLSGKTISTLMHMDNMVMHISFGTAVTVFWNTVVKGYKGTYIQVSIKNIIDDGKEHPLCFPVPGNRFVQLCSDTFTLIPSSPVAYWASPNMIRIFSNRCLADDFTSGGRNKTHNDEKYLRLIWEVPRSDKWTLYAKGGAFRKWYGDIEYLAEWTDTAKAEYEKHGGLVNKMYWNKEGITWTIVTAYKASFRYKQEPVIYSSVSPTIFNSSFSLDKYVLALLNSSVAENLLSIMNPTLATNVSDILGIPYIERDKEKVEKIATDCICTSKIDWDSFETSWDFQRHPLVTPAIDHGYMRLSDCYKEWDRACNERFAQLKANEEELNRIFIEIYGLQDELTPDVADKDVTVRRADLGRDIRSLISYAVGCMFGRYSLDTPGLVYAGGDWETTNYQLQTTNYKLPTTNYQLQTTNFPPVTDAILPICDDEYFEDDIVGRFVRFIETVYGKATLEENLRFIADALGGKGSARDVIRSYFLNDFYPDHLKVYQKRPIYWLFDSGKKNGFKCLIYLHRYQPDTIARIRTDYVHEQQSRYRTAIAELEGRMDKAGTGERVKLSKRLDVLRAQAEELRVYEEKIHHLADQMIKIDLDAGVKHNYEIFKDVLSKIK